MENHSILVGNVLKHYSTPPGARFRWFWRGTSRGALEQGSPLWIFDGWRQLLARLALHDFVRVLGADGAELAKLHGRDGSQRSKCYISWNILHWFSATRCAAASQSQAPKSLSEFGSLLHKINSNSPVDSEKHSALDFVVLLKQPPDSRRDVKALVSFHFSLQD